MMSELRAGHPGATLRHAMDLSEAHELSEKVQPDLVVFDEAFLQEAGFPVYLSMLSALAIDWVVTFTTSLNPRLPARRQVHITALKSHVQKGATPRPGKGAARPTQSADRKSILSAEKAASSRPTPRWNPVVMGASTGGIEALIKILSHFPTDGPPTLVVQHINGSFITGLTDRLNRMCAPSVCSATERSTIQPGHIYFAPGDTRHLIIAPDGRSCRFEEGPPQSGHRPSVDTLFASAARAWGHNCVGVILTGMGRDGAFGLLKMRERGAWTIGQDKESSVVYGMPRAAEEAGALNEVLPLADIGKAVLRAASNSQPTGQTIRSAPSGAVAPG